MAKKSVRPSQVQHAAHDPRRLDDELDAVVVSESFARDEGADPVRSEVGHSGQVENSRAFRVADGLEDRVGEVFDHPVIDIAVGDEPGRGRPVVPSQRPERSVEFNFGQIHNPKSAERRNGLRHPANVGLTLIQPCC